MPLFRRASKSTAEDAIRQEYRAKTLKAEEARRRNAQIDAALDGMHRESVEWGKRRAALRAKCPLSNHDRCLSH